MTSFRCQFHQHFMSSFCAKILCQKITNPYCKHLKAVQRTLVWLSMSPILYKQLFHTKVLCAPFMCLQFGFVIFWQKEFGTKAALKMLVKLTPGGRLAGLKWHQQGQANNTGVPPDQKVNKAEELTYHSRNISVSPFHPKRLGSYI
jgi:hypothetical protein